MKYDDTTDGWNDRRDKGRPPRDFADLDRVALVSDRIQDVRLKPVSRIGVLRNLARLSRQMGGHR